MKMKKAQLQIQMKKMILSEKKYIFSLYLLLINFYLISKINFFLTIYIIHLFINESIKNDFAAYLQTLSFE